MGAGFLNEALILLRRLLVQKGIQGIILTQEATVSWIFKGRYHIAITTEAACAAVLVTHTTVEAIVNNIEAQRLQDEEGLIADIVHIHAWYDDLEKIKWLSTWRHMQGVVEEATLQTEVQQLRLRLDESLLAEVRDLGRSIAEVLYTTCVSLRPTQTEYEVAGLLSAHCLARGIEPIVNLVAGARRANLYRHVMPTYEPLERYVMISVGGRRNGVVLSATRMVHFGSIDKEIEKKYHAVLQVEAALLHASVVGERLGNALATGVMKYGELGYPDEWKLHHQGGIAGYLPREIRAIPDHSMTLEPQLLVAWNPTIQGVKAEDTVLLGKDGAEIITVDGEFPTELVSCEQSSFRLPSILEL